MLYIVYGTDQETARAKARALVDSLRAKRPDAAFVHIDRDSWSPAALEEHAGGQGLFSNKYIVFLDRVSENAEAKEAMAEYAPLLQESLNIFIMLEGKLLAAQKKTFEKHAEKMVECEKKAAAAASKKEAFNVFELGDALGSRQPFAAWKIYRQAIDSGIEPENIAGTLFWQVKSMTLAAAAATAGQAGLNPFVFGKSKRFAANYGPAELSSLASDLIALYHDGHRGAGDMELALEKLLLNCAK